MKKSSKGFIVLLIFVLPLFLSLVPVPEVHAWLENGWEVMEIADAGTNIANGMLPSYTQSNWYGEQNLWSLWVRYNASGVGVNDYQIVTASSSDQGETWNAPESPNVNYWSAAYPTYSAGTTNDLSYLYLRYTTESVGFRAMFMRGEFRQVEEDIVWDSPDRAGSYPYSGYFPTLSVDNASYKFDGSDAVSGGGVHNAWGRKGDSPGNDWSTVVHGYGIGEYVFESDTTQSRVIPVIKNMSTATFNSNEMYYVWSSQDKPLQGNLMYNLDTTFPASQWVLVENDGEISDYEPTEEYAFATASNHYTEMVYIAYVTQSDDDIQLVTRYPNQTFTEINVLSGMGAYVQPWISVSSFPVSNSTSAKDNVYVVWKTEDYPIPGNNSIWMSVIDYTNLDQGEASNPFILHSTGEDIQNFNMYRYSWKESGDDYDDIRFIIGFTQDDNDSANYDVMAIVFDPKVLPPVVPNYAVEITNMEGCGDWVFAGISKFYDFEAEYNFTVGEYPALLGVRFSDGYHNIEFSYNVSSSEATLEEGEDYVVLDQGSYGLTTNETLYDLYTWTFSVLFKESIYDALDVDMYYRGVNTIGEGTTWEISAYNYFSIYVQGGLTGFGETAGASGQIPGGRPWEIYAGGTYIKADIFEEYWQYLNKEIPSHWRVYDYSDESANNFIGIVNDRWVASPYLTTQSIRVQDGNAGGSYTPQIRTTYDVGVQNNYSVQVMVNVQDNTTGQTTIILKGLYRGVDATIAAIRLGFAADFDGVYYDNVTGSFYGGYNYDVDTWHTIRFDVVPTGSIVTAYINYYFDGNLIGTTLNMAAYYANDIELTSILIGAGLRISYFDNILVWRAFAGGSQGTAWAYSYYRNLQHLHMTLGFGTADEGIFSWAEPDINDQIGYIELGMNVCSRQDIGDWYQQWKVRIAIADGVLSIDNNWVYLNISWFERDNLVKSDQMYAYYEGYKGNKDYLVLYVDLWFPKTNSSQAVAGRVNAQTFGITDTAPNWLKLLTFGYYQVWADKRMDETYSVFESPLYNQTGSIHPSREIYMMMPWVKLYRDGNFGVQYYVYDQGLDFNTLAPNKQMEGIDTPILIETVSVANLQPNLFWQILGVMQEQLRPLFQALEFGALNQWGIFVDFLDTVFSFTGNPNAFSEFMALLNSGWTWFTTGVQWIITLATDLFRLFAVTMTTGLDIFGIFITNWISIIQAITGVFGTAMNTGYDLWNDFQMAEFLQLGSILYVVWLVLYGMNEGWGKVATHLTFVFNVLAFVFHILLSLANFTITIVTTIIESIPIVE